MRVTKPPVFHKDRHDLMPPADPGATAIQVASSLPSVAASPKTSFLMRQVLALAAPTTLLASLQLAAQLFETALAARQGTDALAGWAVVLPFALLMQQMSTGAMGGGVVAAIARALGAGRRDEAASLVQHALIIALVGGLLFALGLSCFGGLMLDAVAGPASAQAATPYVLWLFGVGALPVWLTNTLASVLRGGGRAIGRIGGGGLLRLAGRVRVAPLRKGAESEVRIGGAARRGARLNRQRRQRRGGFTARGLGGCAVG